MWGTWAHEKLYIQHAIRAAAAAVAANGINMFTKHFQTDLESSFRRMPLINATGIEIGTFKWINSAKYMYLLSERHRRGVWGWGRPHDWDVTSVDDNN